VRKFLFIAPCFLVGFSIFVSCQNTPESKYRDHQVAFTVAESWTVTEEEDLGEGAYYISIEKEGITSSGLIALTWLSDSIELDLWLDQYKIGFREQKEFRNSGLEFSSYKEVKYNNHEARSFSYTASVMDVDISGIIVAFHHNGRTYSILNQGADEDEEKNRQGFDTFKKTLECLH